MISIKKKNEALLYVASEDSGVLREISEYFTFYADGYKWMPAYKNKLWDGKVRLFDLRSRTLPYGLLEETIQFCNDRGYEYTLSDISNRFSFSSEFVDGLTLSLGNKEIKPRDYQLKAFEYATESYIVITYWFW